MDGLFLGMIFGCLIGFLVGIAVGVMCGGDFFEYLTFKKQQEFEKEKYYSEYAERYNKGGK